MSELKTLTVTEPFLKLDCGLGEAPFWEEASNTLRFVDIVKQKLHVVDLNQGPSSHNVKDLDISIGTTADLDGDNEYFIFGGKHGYGKMNRQTGGHEYIKRYWEGEADQSDKEKKFRGNDGAVDAKGRYFVGIMRDPLVNNPTDDGVVFRLDPDLSLHRVIEGVSIPNGISWTKDNKTMYLVDSPTKNIFKYDYDLETGSVSNRRVFFHVDDENGVPDGHVPDEEGCIWQAITWVSNEERYVSKVQTCFPHTLVQRRPSLTYDLKHGCGKVIRISPQGKVLAEVKFPTRCVTCPGFAGEDLYVTSAEEEDPVRFPNSTKLQGAIFKIHVGIRGLRPHKFKLNV